MAPKNKFLEQSGVTVPIICGAMYPCSNPELVAAASEAGALGIVQPLTLNFVYKYEFRQGLKFIRSLTSKPIGMNALIEASSKIYMARMRHYVDVALEEGVRFFITALGDPNWVVEKVHAAGGFVYHDVTERKWADKALKAGVDGLICVNNRAGGHAGVLSPEQLARDLASTGKPLICAGGIGSAEQMKAIFDMGYCAVQMGTRFIASVECRAPDSYKAAILKAQESDIVLTEKLTGVPVSVINNEYVRNLGTKAGPLARRLLKHPRFKHWMRLFYSIKSFRDLRRSMTQSKAYEEYWQAGKSAGVIQKIETVSEIVRDFKTASSRRSSS